MLTDIATVFWRDWIVLRRRMGTFIFSRMIAPVLYIVAFGWGVGRSVSMSQGSYLDFIVPGILALNSMNISFNSVGGPLHTQRLYYQSLEEYLAAPISSVSFVIGKVLAGTLRGLISSAIIIVLVCLFGAHNSLNGLFWVVLLLNCLIFSALGFVAAMLIDSHEDMGNFSTYVLLPMSFLCSTFFSASQLPPVVHWLLEFLPLTHASEALRAIDAGGAPAGLSWLVLVVYVVLLMAISIWTMGKVRQ
jgi:ABC-2 type transport system permease protein